VYWVLGGGVRGGRIVGEQTPITQATLFQSRDYPVLNEYRAVLRGLFARMYGLDTTQLDKVLPGVQSRELGLACFVDLVAGTCNPTQKRVRIR
jgi:uncharacterized protein (DUF1501 family)